MDSHASTSPILARLLASASALLSVALWVRLAWINALGPGGEAVPPALVAACFFSGVAISGAVAAFRDAPLVTLVTGFIGAFPVGLYFLPAPGVLKLVGVAPLLMVAAGILQLRALRESSEW